LSFSVVINVSGLEGLPQKMRAVRQGILARLDTMLRQAGETIVGISREDYLSGPRPEKLGRISGDLARSVLYRISGSSVQVGSNLPYAPVHEYGATIVPVRARALVFKTLDGAWHSAQKVVIPPRPFLAPALNDAMPSVIEIVQRQCDAAIKEALA